MKSILKRAGIVIGALVGLIILVNIAFGETRLKKVYILLEEIISIPSVYFNSPSRAITQTPLLTHIPTAKLFGPFDWIPDGSKGYTLTRIGKNVGDMEAARVNGVKAFVALTGSRWRYTDDEGCFDLQMWKDELDRKYLAGIQPYVDDGTIVGLYAIDEPHDWDCGPTHEELNKVCRYAHEKLPGIACGFNTKAWWLEPGKDQLSELDFLFSQTNFRKVNSFGGWTAWAEQQFSDAYWFDGPFYLSINAYTHSPTDQQVNDAAIELCQTEAAGVMMWKWDYIEGRDLSRAIEFCTGQEELATPTPTALPILPPDVSLLPGLSWEAEKGQITAPFAIADGAVSQNILTLNPAEGGRATYRFSIQEAGEYTVQVTLNAFDASSNSLFVGMDTEPDTSMIWDVLLTNGFEERTVSWMEAASPDENASTTTIFRLTPGEHILIIRGREAGILLDKVEVAKVPIIQPTTTATPIITATQVATQIPTNTPISSVTGWGNLFGPFEYIPDGTLGYTLTRTNYKVSNFEAARVHGVKVFVAVTGSRYKYEDVNGCFDLQMWKEEFDSHYDGLQPFVNDGTIIGLYAIDEPHDWNCGPTHAELNEVCRHAHEKLPGIACGFNTKAWWLEPGKDQLSEIDFLFSQTNFSDVNDYGSWTAWAEQQFSDAYWFDGPFYLSINAYSYSPTDEQVENAAIELCQTNAAGVMMWKWDYVEGRDLSRAIAACTGQ